VEINGQKLLDGGIADSIPVKFFESQGYEKNIAVLTQPRNYTKSKNSLLPLIKVKYRKYPEFVKAVAERHVMYNDTLEYIREREMAGTLFVIAPDKDLPVGKIEKDAEKLNEAYSIGRRITERNLEDIKNFLE